MKRPASLAARTLLSSLLLLLAWPVPSFSQPKFSPDVRLVASDIDCNDFMGSTVALSGNLLVAGVPSDDSPEINRGSAYVFRSDGTTWMEEQKLLASDGEKCDFFGRAVATDGSSIFVGADLRVYVFEYNGATWIETQTIQLTRGTNVRSIKIEDDVLAVGTFGTVFLFRFSGFAWILEQEIRERSGFDGLGESLALSDGILVAGAPLDWVVEPNDVGGEGAAYVYEHDGSQWNRTQKLVSDDRTFRECFGERVDVQADTLVVDTASHSNYIFDRDQGSGSWVLQQRIFPGLGGSHHVVLVGDRLFTNGRRNSDNLVLVYRFDGASWVEEKHLAPHSTSVFNHSFAAPIASSGDILAIGDPSHDSADPGNDCRSGSIVLYRHQDLTVPSCLDGTVNSGVGPTVDVLTVSGFGSGICRRVNRVVGESFTLNLDLPPQTAVSGRYILYAWATSRLDCVALEAGGETLGFTLAPTPLLPGLGPQPFRCVRGAGIPRALCGTVPEVTGAPAMAPWSVHKAGGLPNPIVLGLQAIIEDGGSASSVGFSVSNALILDVLPF